MITIIFWLNATNAGLRVCVCVTHLSNNKKSSKFGITLNVTDLSQGKREQKNC